MLIGGVVVFGGLFAAYVFSGEDVTLGDDMCPEGLAVDAHTIILVDATDNIKTGDLNLLRQRVTGIGDELDMYAKFSMFELSGDDTGQPRLTEVFSLCNPGRSDQVDTRSNSKRRARYRFKERFQEPLETSLETLAGLQEGQSTPLLESLQRLTLRPDFDSDVANRELLIVSDLLHHTPEFSQYASNYSYDTLRDASTPAIVSDLRGVDVEVFYVRRDGLSGLQSVKHRSFWKDYFTSSGATMIFNPPV